MKTNAFLGKSRMGNHGFVLLFTSVFVVSMAALGLGAMYWSGADHEVADREKFSAQAFWQAEAGVHKAMRKMNANACTNFTSSPCGVASPTFCANCSCGGGNKYLCETLSVGGVSQGQYAVTVDPGSSVMTSTGTVNDKSRKIIVGSSPFHYALFGNNSVTLRNNDDVNGIVGTNGPSNAISSGNGTTIDEVAPNAGISLPLIGLPLDFNATNANQANPAPATISGSGDYRYSKISTSLTVTGNVRMYLTAATSIDLSGGTAVVINANSSLTIYAEGGINADTGNGVDFNVLNNPSPRNLIFYGISTLTTTINIKNNSGAYMAIYAPNADITLSKNNGEFHGSFIGKTLYVKNNNNIDYDPVLANYGGGGIGNFYIRSWEEAG